MTFLPEAGLSEGGEGGIVSTDQAGDFSSEYSEALGVPGAGPTCINRVCACILRVHALRRDGANCMGSAGGVRTHC